MDDKSLYQDQMHTAGLLRIKGNRYYKIRTCPNPHVPLLCHHWKCFISTMNKHKSYPSFTQIISLLIWYMYCKEAYLISNTFTIYLSLWFRYLDKALTLYFIDAALRAKKIESATFCHQNTFLFCKVSVFILHSLSYFRINTSNYATDIFWITVKSSYL